MLVTWVRIDIMKAMTIKFISEREELFVFGYVSRPVLYIKPKDPNQLNVVLLFGCLDKIWIRTGRF
jgi:hypothetical protein